MLSMVEVLKAGSRHQAMHALADPESLFGSVFGPNAREFHVTLFEKRCK